MIKYTLNITKIDQHLKIGFSKGHKADTWLDLRLSTDLLWFLPFRTCSWTLQLRYSIAYDFFFLSYTYLNSATEKFLWWSHLLEAKYSAAFRAHRLFTELPINLPKDAPHEIWCQKSWKHFLCTSTIRYWTIFRCICCGDFAKRKVFLLHYHNKILGAFLKGLHCFF